MQQISQFMSIIFYFKMLKYKEKIYNLCELSPLILQHISTEKEKKIIAEAVPHPIRRTSQTMSTKWTLISNVLYLNPV